ncbi:MAG: DUF5719 family protein [Bifidobacteriaceae bacterium]|nr:DUF5719 family protein [Bifidobacteriaceae bacterium]
MKTLKRILSGLMALVLVGAVGALVWADRAHPGAAAPPGAAQMVAVPPGDSVAVCPGGLRLPTEGAGEPVYDPRFDPAATQVDSISRVVVEGGQGGRAAPLEEGAATDLPGPLAAATATVADQPIRVEAFSTAAAPALAAGGVFQHIGDGDLRGVAASPCVPPAPEAWVVAGSTEPGSSARLILANPGLTNVTADLEVWDAAGPVEAIGLTGLVVPPSSQRAVLLEGFVGDAARLAVHVAASGGDLAVFLQHSRLQGTTQGGVELAVPGLAPATEVVVAGLDVTESTFDSSRACALRVANPGQEPAAVSVELWGPDGPTSLPGLEAAAVGAGLVTDLSLAGLPAGRYMAAVSSDQPVAVAGLSLRAGAADQPEEFAWTSSSAPAAHGFAALPGADLTWRLVAGAGADSRLTLTPVGADGQRGAATSLAAPARTALVVDAGELGAGQGAAALEFAWDGPPGQVALVASATDSQGELISVLVPLGHWAAATEVAAYPRAP